MLAGIGFTMSLFVAGPAFGAGDQMSAVKTGILVGAGAARGHCP
jgi:Na+/H+ antiporter NhaA